MLDGVLPFTQVFASEFRGLFRQASVIHSHLPNRSLLQEQMVVVAVGGEVWGARGRWVWDKDTSVFMATQRIKNKWREFRGSSAKYRDLVIFIYLFISKSCFPSWSIARRQGMAEREMEKMPLSLKK